MRKLYSIVLTGAVLSGLGLIQPGVSSAAPDCNNHVHGAVTLAGNLRVTGPCDLAGTTVTGSVAVLPGGSLTMTDSTVNGSVTQTGGTLLSKNSTIRGSVTVSGIAMSSHNEICGGSVGGSVTVKSVTEGMGSGGWWRLLGQGFVSSAGQPCENYMIPSLTIGGSVTFTGNQIFTRLANAQSVGGSVTVKNNGPTTLDAKPTWITDNALIKGSLVCSGNNSGVEVVQAVGTIKGARTGQCAP